MITVGGQLLIVDDKPPESVDDGDDAFRWPHRCTTRPGVLCVKDERIERIDWGEVPNSIDVGGEDRLICPGFVDTHLHLPQFDSIGVHGLPLLRWLDQAIFPAENRWNDLSYAKAMIRRVIRQCLSVGTLGIAAYATSAHDAAVAALDSFASIGFRGVIGQVMMDQGAPDALLHSIDQLRDEVEQTLEQFPAGGRLAAAVTPRFALACSSDLLDVAGRIAQRHRCLVQTHLAETVAECDAVMDMHRERYIEVYRKAGLLGPRTVLGHGIYLNDSDREQLAQTESIIAHCPTANSFLRSGVMALAAHRTAGISVSLGSDIGAGYERSMVRVGRAAIEAATQIANNRTGATAPESPNPSAIPEPSQMWYQITTGNALSLGLQDCGRLAEGYSADLLVVQPDAAWQTSPDPLSMLMYAWDDRWIRHVYLRGNMIDDSRRTEPLA